MAVTELEVDLAQYPQMYTPRPGQEVTLGDLHGNALKLLHFLVANQVVSISQENYQHFVKLYAEPSTIDKKLEGKSFQESFYLIEKEISNIDLDNIYDFFHVLDQIKVIDTSRLIRLIGDETADRGSSDLYTKFLLFKLHNSSLNLEILLSNHGAKFIKFLETILDPRNLALFAKGHTAFQLLTLDTRGELNKYISSHMNTPADTQDDPERNIDYQKASLQNFSLGRFRAFLQAISSLESFKMKSYALLLKYLGQSTLPEEAKLLEKAIFTLENIAFDKIAEFKIKYPALWSGLEKLGFSVDILHLSKGDMLKALRAKLNECVKTSINHFIQANSEEAKKALEPLYAKYNLALLQVWDIDVFSEVLFNKFSKLFFDHAEETESKHRPETDSASSEGTLSSTSTLPETIEHSPEHSPSSVLISEAAKKFEENIPAYETEQSEKVKAATRKFIERSYLPVLELLSYSLSKDKKSIIVYSHAPIDLNAIKKLAAALKKILRTTLDTSVLKNNKDDLSKILNQKLKFSSPEKLAEAIDWIRLVSRRLLLDKKQLFKHYTNLPELAFIANNTESKYLSWWKGFSWLWLSIKNFFTQAHEKVLTFVHGHTNKVKSQPDRINLDTNLGKSLEPKDMKGKMPILIESNTTLSDDLIKKAEAQGSILKITQALAASTPAVENTEDGVSYAKGSNFSNVKISSRMFKVGSDEARTKRICQEIDRVMTDMHANGIANPELNLGIKNPALFAVASTYAKEKWQVKDQQIINTAAAFSEQQSTAPATMASA